MSHEQAVWGRKIPVPGILGGMGPLAHVILERQLIAAAYREGARRDQDYPVWIVRSATDIPDRTESLVSNRRACVERIIHHARALQRAGADFLVVPCHSAHVFYEEVTAEIEIPWLHMVDLVAQYLVKHHANKAPVGVLGTSVTLTSGVFQKALGRAGFDTVTFFPESPEQKRVMEAIYDASWGVKSTGVRVSPEATAVLYNAAELLLARGVSQVVAGCTEISVVLDADDSPPAHWIDPVAVVALETLAVMRGSRKLPDDDLPW